MTPGPAFLTGPELFVVLLAVVFLAFPCLYLYMALRERGVLDRLRRGRP
jgi:hypothetical protein